MTIRIGTSGWSYDDWSDVLYPPRTPAAARLAYYADEFDTVELNASFYRWPRDATFTGWRRRLPPGFVMSVKAQRGLTHFRRLKAPELWIERFERCRAALGDKLGVVLVQLHPEQQRDDARLDHFLGLLPEALRVAMELRHPSWDHPEVYALLHRHRAAYVVMSGAGLPCIPRVTTDIAYVRMHGPDPRALYTGSYSARQLGRWADQIQLWHSDGRDVYVYFNNDGSGYAVQNARTLKRLLGQ
jgi:uncharacterized protein YecE (DUF72 family)